MLTQKLKLFADAFSDGGGGCRRECECGKTFYNSDGGWDFEEGEIERLEEARATNLPHTVCTISFEGSMYVWDCECWHERANKILGFLDGHADEIARYLNARKAAMRAAADAAVFVPSDGWEPMATAPKDCTRVDVLMADGTIHTDAHWACDLSGEEQPPFRGWFVGVKDASGKHSYYRGIEDPVAWRKRN